MAATLGRDLEGSGIFHPTTVRQGTENPLYFYGLPVRWANADVVKMPEVSERLGSEYRVGPSPAQAQGGLFGLRFASALNTNLLKTRRPHSGVTVAVPRPTADQVPDQRTAFLGRTRGMVTEFPAARPQRWDMVGGGVTEG